MATIVTIRTALLRISKNDTYFLKSTIVKVFATPTRRRLPFSAFYRRYHPKVHYWYRHSIHCSHRFSLSNSVLRLFGRCRDFSLSNVHDSCAVSSPNRESRRIPENSLCTFRHCLSTSWTTWKYVVHSHRGNSLLSAIFRVRSLFQIPDSLRIKSQWTYMVYDGLYLCI